MGRIITIREDNNEITGEITTQTASDIEVCLRSPFGDYQLSNGRHIAYFARAHASFAGEEGIRKAKQLLKNIYDLAKFIKENEEKLVEIYKAVQARLEKLGQNRYLNESDFGESKRQLKKWLKQNVLSPKEYQKALESLREKNDNFVFERDRFLEEFFEPHFQRTMSYCQRQQIYGIISKIHKF